MSQPQANRLVSKLRFQVDKRKNLKAGGPQNRHERLKKLVTGLLRHERLELNYIEGDEARGYVERLISDAIRHGDCHIPTMEMASYWITDKSIIHKLFKVLAPRYKGYETVSYTKMWRAPRMLPGHGRNKCVLELRNNIYPPLGPDRINYKNLIHNVLLREAKLFFDKVKQKEAEIQLKYKLTETKTEESNTNSAQATVSQNLESVEDSVKVDSQESKVDSQGFKVDSEEPKADSQGFKVDSQESKADSQESKADSQESKVDSQGFKVDSQESKVDCQEIKNESSSFGTAKGSIESQNSSDSTNLDSSESLGIDKIKIKDEELPEKEK